MPRKSLHSSINNLSYKSLLIILFFLLISIVVLWKFVLPNHKVEASWWNDGWNYRKAVSISNTSGSNLTDFQISLSIGTSALIASGKMQSDCDDIRITDINGNLLPYWIETGTCNTDITNIYIKINSLPINGGSLYIYYGNSNTASATDATAVPQTCSKANSFFGTNFYYINPDGKKDSTPIQAYCDMTTDGGGWTLVASWNTSQEWTKASNSISDVFGTTPKNTVSSNFGNAPINDFRILASDTITSVGTSAYADWYYHYNTITTWKEVWAPSANTGGNITSGYISSTPRQALKPFNYSYSLKFSYQVTQTWNNLSDWGLSANAYYGLPNYWLALTSPGNQFGVYGAVASSGSNDGSLGICPSNSSNCATGQDSGINQTKIGYDDNIPSASFGATATTNVGANPPVDATTKLWWFIRNGTPTSISYSVSSISSEEAGGGPIAYWKFDKGSGITAYDSTSNQNNGTLGTGNSAPTWADQSQCISGKCLKFDGTNQYIYAPQNSQINLTNNAPYTITYWLKLPTLPSGFFAPIMKGAFSLGYGHLITNSGNLAVYTDNDSDPEYQASNFIGSNDLNKWVQITQTYNGSSISVYKNGKIFGSSGVGISMISNTRNLYFGTNNIDTYFLKGLLDDIKIYPYARTADQIKKDYNSRGGSSQGTSANLGTAGNDNNLSEGLVGYWKMDEGVGTSTADYSGNSKIGTLSNTNWSNGKFGVGTSFNGTNAYISLGQVKSIGAETYSFWFKSTSTNTAHVILATNDTTSNYGISRIGDNLLFLRNGSNYQYFNNIAQYYDGQWHHLVITVPGGSQSDITNTKAYIDNKEMTKGSAVSSVAPGSYSNFYIATGSYGYFNGSIDEVRIYNRALSPSEVTQLYEFAPGPVGYWGFDDGSGSTVKDKSGNNLNGTIAGNAVWKSGGYCKVGGCLTLDNIDDRVTVAHSSLLEPASITVEGWVKLNNTGDRHIIFTKWLGYSFEISAAGYPYFRLNGSSPGDLYSSKALTWGEWHHIAATLDNDTKIKKVYLDGINVGSTTTTGSITYDQSTLAFPYSSAHYGSGFIDEFKIYNYARTPKQIIEDMNTSAPAASSKSILAYYKFDEGSGTTVYNSGIGGTAINGIFGTGNSAPTWTNEGKNGKALNFSDDDYVVVSSSPTINMTDSITVSTWIKTTNSSADQTIISRNGPLFLRLNGGKFRIGIYTGSWFFGNGNIPINSNQWYHVVLVYDGSFVKSYVNGVLDIKSAKTGLLTSFNNLYFGRPIPGGEQYPFYGSIDEIKIYNYALTDDEVKQDYNQSSALQMGQTSQTIGGTTTSLEYCIPGDTSYCASPVAEWKMDEGSGTSANDTSGSNNNGIIGSGSSAPSWVQGKIGKALSFNGSTNSLPLTSTINLGNTDWTVSAWMKTTSSGTNTLISNSSGGPVANLLGTMNSKIVYYHYNSSWLTESGTSNIADGRWHFLTWANHSNQTIDLYVDGIGQTFGAPSTVMNTGPVNQIGRNWSTTANASIDQVKIYNYARTPAQIAYDYNKGGPVGWWKFDECQGNIAYDWSGIGNTGTIIIGASGTQNSLGTCSVGTSAAWTNGATGKLNSSLNFDGTDDYISIPNLLTDYPVSVSMWIKPNTITDADIAFYLYLASGKYITGGFYTSYGFITNTTNVHADASLFPIGQWKHVVVTMTSSTTGKIYVDGIDKTTSSAQRYVESGTISNIAARNSANLFQGQIDDVKVYNYGLTDTQVKTLYNNGAVNFN